MLETAVSFFGAPVSRLEAIAFVLAIGMVACSIREHPLTWPLAIVSSALYVWLFWVSKLYGETVVNVFFVLSGMYGAWQWMFGQRGLSTQPLHVAALASRERYFALLAWIGLWLGFALALAKFTDSDVPWADAFVTAGSFLGTYLLARKYIENWHVWLVVNAASVALFSFKSLWLTALLYAILFVLSIVGLRGWQRRLE